jgi:uncharacterized protein YdhG (YjbR/CyaY superfamily)
MQMKNFKTVDAYIASYPKEIQVQLQRLRKAIKEAMPGSEEAIRYGIPTFRLHDKNIVHIGGYETHIGFYPGAMAIKTFAGKLKAYDLSKGTVRFEIDAKLPLGLVKEIVKYNVRERF